ncbi:hypothetical protein ACT3UJ_06330 [Halomonas sp. 86]|uniref:hypothetical protein n=1 Tax=unclassified Halomonas TaxID=2609666 RepID=UPI0040345E9C
MNNLTTPEPFVHRVTAALSQSGTISLHAQKHYVQSENDKGMIVACIPDNQNSPTQLIHWHKFQAGNPSAVALFTGDRTPRGGKDFFRRDSITHLPIAGHYIAGVSVWSREVDLETQKQLLGHVLSGWASDLSDFYAAVANVSLEGEQPKQAGAGCYLGMSNKPIR